MGGTARSRTNEVAPGKALKIGEVAEQVGVAVGTIRYYESLGLIEPDYRSESGYRYYGLEAVRKLQFIKKAQCLEFSLYEIQQVLGVRQQGNPACSKVRELLDGKIAYLEEQIARLQSLKGELTAYQQRWQGEPEDAPGAEALCSLIEGVASAHPVKLKPLLQH
ncbi:MAG: heavy metal-responsive transcriptional regulator [Gemmatimonadaceae bacterium]|nr:heavy metal-responsive transcriptional regulator [Gloeobacterales cyanobacterium ES-bin-141]